MITEATKFLVPGHVFTFSDAWSGILIFHFEKARQGKPEYELQLAGTPVPLDRNWHEHMRDRKLGLRSALEPRASIVVSQTEDDFLFPQVSRPIGPEPMAWQIFNHGPMAVERIELTPFGAANEALALKDYPIPLNLGHLARRLDEPLTQEDLDLTWSEFALKFGGFTDFLRLRKLFWEEDAWSSEYPSVDVATLGRVGKFAHDPV